MEQRVELNSEATQVKGAVTTKISEEQKKLDSTIKIREIMAAPDYLYMSAREFTQHFTNLLSNEEFPLWETYTDRDFMKIMGYANRSLFETLLSYFQQKNENFVIASTPLHHTSWRNGIEKYAKPENVHIIDMNDSLNGIEKFPDIEKCDVVVITHMFGQDMDMKGLAEFKEKTGAIVIEDRVQGGTLDLKFSSELVDIATYSMAMDKRPIALGGAFLYIKNEYSEFISYLIETIENYPPEPRKKRFVELLKKIPTYLFYNRRGIIYFLFRILRAIKFNILEFTNMYRKQNPGFSHADFHLKPSPGLLKSMTQHYHDHKGMENLFEDKFMLFRSYLSDSVIERYFPWYRDAALTPYNTIFIEEKYVDKFLKFMSKSGTVIIWNPTYKMFNFPYEGDEKYLRFFNGFVYLPCLANMNREEIRYLADRIEKFDQIFVRKP